MTLSPAHDLEPHMTPAESALAEKAERYRSLFAYSPQGVFSLDLEGRHTDANDALQQLSGRSLEELSALNFSDCIHPADRSQVNKALGAVLDKVPQQLLVRLVTADRSVRDVKLTVVPVIVGGVVVGVHGIVEDMTVVNQTNRELEMAYAARTLFLANVSHEVRTPLTSILAATELLMVAGLGEEEMHLVKMVHRGSQRLLHLVNDILDFSRLEAGKVSLRPAPFRPQSLIKDVLEWAGPRAHARGLSLTWSLDESLPEALQGDELRISQVLSNLVENALKFTEAGDEVRIHGRCLGAGTTPRSGPRGACVRVEFGVTDTGQGVRAEDLETLFDSFTQADPSATRRHEGVGLGLAICRDLVSLMGGELDVASAPGGGSTFKFVLLLDEARASEVDEGDL